MSNYLEEQRLIFKDTIKKNLIGPGSDIISKNDDEEILSDYPLSRYYSGILFPERETNSSSESFGFEDEIIAKAEIEDDGDGENQDEEKGDADAEVDDSVKDFKDTKEEVEKEYSEANQYFPTNFGLTFCVPKETKNIEVSFSYARYRQLKTEDGKIEIKKEDFEWFTNSPHNPIKDLLIYEDGFLRFDKEKFKKSDLSVRNLRSKFLQTEEQNELFDSIPYKKVNLLLGRLWQRYKEEPFTVELNLMDKDFDEGEGFSLKNADDSAEMTSCFYKKIYEKGDRKYIKILLANRDKHPKRKFSFSNEKLNAKAIFQGEIVIRSKNFLPYKEQSEINPFDEELNLINFQYRNVKSFGIGHGCAVAWNDNERPTELKTTFLPEVDIKNFSNDFRDDFPKDLQDITELKKLSVWTDLSKAEIIKKLTTFAHKYQDWITEQKTTNTTETHRPIFEKIISQQEDTLNRLVKNISFLEANEIAFKSFKLANTAMYIQMLISQKKLFGEKGIDLSEMNPEVDYDNLDFFRLSSFNPKYRPFQLAFFLLNIESLIDSDSQDRNDLVDLLWFPTGGGKTEAYLALTAFTIISRRLLNPSSFEGVSVIMRYTLRLLTAQQFERATKLILSLDFLRQKLKVGNEFYFGDKEISIGMWVGASTTPNSFKDAEKIVKDISTQLILLNSGKKGNHQRVNTFPVKSCPWCGCNTITKIETGYLQQGYSSSLKNFSLKCLNKRCAFSSELPVLFVDDKIYDNPPSLLFATVDKFAMLSHREEGHVLFNSKDNTRLPPDLIIQDELHLLSGPLGSITGLYESVVEMLSTKNGKKPKIIASTATTRNTEHQVAMLYGNRKLNVFPPSGHTYDDNFFSFVSADSKRKHIGFMPTGKTALNSQIRILGNLLLARIQLFRYFVETENLSREEAIMKTDYYWTIVSFYNSLKDVGKIYNKVPAEILSLLKRLHKMYDIDQQQFSFNYLSFPARTKELTSRIESSSIKQLLDELESNFELVKVEGKTYVKNTVDLVLASNMFSVGIDIKRLNVMLMNGQPKNVAEYIQASSRVGRDEKGIVFNLLDANRSRDKSYFENYVSFNNAYYKYVEPLSITPFTEITLQKVLASLLTCFIRHKIGLNKDSDAANFDGNIHELELFLTERITNQGHLQFALQKLNDLKNQWLQKIETIPELKYKNGLIKKMSEFDDWSLMMSMREIDTNSVIKIIN